MHPTNRPHILYVEDDHDLARLVRQRLRGAGIDVDLAFDGDEALSKFAAAPYGLLLLDQALPGRDGLSVLRALAAFGPLPPTIMVTGAGNERVAVETMKLGADDYVIKDLDGGWLDLLPAVVERVLGHRRLVEEKKAAEAALREKEQQLLHAQKLESLGLLAGGIAHDFNNILAGIMGYADLVKQRLPVSDPSRQDIDVIKQAVRRAADLTRQMLAYSGKGKFLVEAVDLSHVVRETEKMLQVTLSKKAAVKYNLAPDLPAIQADASQIHQVLLNLMINASESLGDASGAIAIATDAVRLNEAECAALCGGDDFRAGLYVRLEVTDTGCGMDKATVARIFDPFFTTKFTGRGLGLAAVHGIVRGHKGAIQVASAPGRGTTFRLYFPADGAAAASAGGPLQREAWRGSGTVLVVDDEEIVRRLAQRTLEEVGFSVLTASDGDEALQVYGRHRDEIVCVLLDLTMPKRDGAETFQELRRLCPQVRVVLTSGYSEERVAVRFAGEGPAGFLEKPYEFHALIAALRRAIEGRAIERHRSA